MCRSCSIEGTSFFDLHEHSTFWVLYQLATRRTVVWESESVQAAVLRIYSSQRLSLGRTANTKLRYTAAAARRPQTKCSAQENSYAQLVSTNRQYHAKADNLDASTCHIVVCHSAFLGSAGEHCIQRFERTSAQSPLCSLRVAAKPVPTQVACKEDFCGRDCTNDAVRDTAERVRFDPIRHEYT